MKIDVQGYEKNDIMGATKLFNRIGTILIEVSYVELYKNQHLFDDIYKLLYMNDFRYMGNFEQAISKINGIPIYSNAIFQYAH